MKKNITKLFLVIMMLGCMNITSFAEETVPAHEVWDIWENEIAVETAAADYDFTKKNDPADFRPTLTTYMLEDQTSVKGNIIVLSGGGDRNRSNAAEGIPCCEWLNSIGYNAYLLDYRVQPYETADASLDTQRAVRYIKYYAEEKGIEENVEQQGQERRHIPLLLQLHAVQQQVLLERGAVGVVRLIQRPVRPRKADTVR